MLNIYLTLKSHFSSFYSFIHSYKICAGVSPIIVIGVLHSAIVALLIRCIVCSIHVIDVHFGRPLEPSPLAELDSAEAQCDQEQDEENT